MLIKFCLIVWGIVIIAIVAIGIIMSKVIENIIFPDTEKYNLDNSSNKKINVNNKRTKESVLTIPEEDSKIADAHKFLLLTSVTQQILENTMKTNNEVVFIAVYIDDGTIIAHFKPERIGKNMFDVDVEFSEYSQDIFDAMNNKKLFKGIKYDPLLNDNIKFMLKPLQLSNFDYNMSLLMGIREHSKGKLEV